MTLQFVSGINFLFLPNVQNVRNIHLGHYIKLSGSYAVKHKLVIFFSQSLPILLLMVVSGTRITRMTKFRKCAALLLGETKH